MITGERRDSITHREDLAASPSQQADKYVWQFGQIYFKIRQICTFCKNPEADVEGGRRAARELIVGEILLPWKTWLVLSTLKQADTYI